VSSSARVNVIVEGQTEEAFVKEVLAPELGARGVFLTARRLLTGRSRGRTYRGGVTSYARARNDILQWLRPDAGAYCTTMLDLYALPSDFPGMTTMPSAAAPAQKVRHLEDAFAADIESERFLPYYQLHEYEALLFTDVDVLDNALEALDGRTRLPQLAAIAASVRGPEEINDGLETAPSKRILRLCPAYEKVVVGVLVAQQTGIAKIRAACPHFHRWLERLEAIAG
jgi:hypothetical protein